MKQLPNTISCVRIGLSIALLFLMEKTILFFAVSLFCGISDMIDGYIARRFKLATRFGAKLDSFADFVFIGISLLVLLLRTGVEKSMPLIGVAMVVAVIRFVNLFITRSKFKQWSVMRTVGNRAAGFVLFLFLPICALIGAVPSVIAIIIGITTSFSAIEESFILLTAETYNANTNGFFLHPKIA